MQRTKSARSVARTPAFCGQGLAGHLDALYHTYGGSYLHTDPIHFPRRFENPDDREVVGFLAAALSYGRVSHIQASVEKLLAVMGEHPARFVRELDPAMARRALAGFVHRFNDARDMALLLHFTSQMLREAGTIEEFFLRGDDPAAADVGPALTSFTERALALDCTPWYRSGKLPADAGVRFFFPSPRDGSACKRLAMFLRWMARRDDGVDLGLWGRLSTARLVIPLDTHLARISMHLGFTARKSPGWLMALEVTGRLRALDPADPVRFDFALCRLGMLSRFPMRGGSPGRACPLCAVSITSPTIAAAS